MVRGSNRDARAAGSGQPGQAGARGGLAHRVPIDAMAAAAQRGDAAAFADEAIGAADAVTALRL